MNSISMDLSLTLDGAQSTSTASSVDATEKEQYLISVCNKDKQPFKWEDGATRLLLDLYNENINNIGPLKKFKNKKNLYAYIAERISKNSIALVGSTQVESKLKQLLKRKNLFRNYNGKSGNNAVCTLRGRTA